MFIFVVIPTAPSKSSSFLCPDDLLRQHINEKMSITKRPAPNAAASKISGDIGRVWIKSIVTELADWACDCDDPAGLTVTNCAIQIALDTITI